MYPVVTRAYSGPSAADASGANAGIALGAAAVAAGAIAVGLLALGAGGGGDVAGDLSQFKALSEYAAAFSAEL